MKYIFIILSFLILCGCENKEVYNEQYINYKKQLFKSNEFTSSDKLPFDINITLEKEQDKVKYNILFNNSKNILHNVQILVVHNQVTNDVYPSIGIFDDKGELEENAESKLELVGYFENIKDIEEVVVNFKFVIKYTDNDGNNKIIYYKTTK